MYQYLLIIINYFFNEKRLEKCYHNRSAAQSSFHMCIPYTLLEENIFSSNNVPMAIMCKKIVCLSNDCRDGVYNATMELHLHNESSYTLQIQLQLHSLYSPERRNTFC